MSRRFSSVSSIQYLLGVTKSDFTRHSGHELNYNNITVNTELTIGWFLDTL